MQAVGHRPGMIPVAVLLSLTPASMSHAGATQVSSPTPETRPAGSGTRPADEAIVPHLGAPPRPGAPPVLRITAATLSRGQLDAGAGTVILEVAPRAEGDPEGSLRLEAVLNGPVASEKGGDLYALNAVLVYPPGRLAFVPGSLRKGELLGRDGRDVLIVGQVNPGKEGRLYVGSSRLGAVPGLAAPEGRSRLFSAAFRVLEPGDSSLAWEDSTFIDHQVKPVEGARFVGGLLHVEGEPIGAGERK